MTEVAELRLEFEREIELLRGEVDELRTQLVEQDSERHSAQKSGQQPLTQENVTAYGVLSLLLLMGSMGPGWYMGFNVMFSEGDDSSGMGLVLVNMFLPFLILIVTWILPLMDRDRLILEVVLFLGYAAFMIYEMTKNLWSPLIQIVMVSSAIFLRHLHQGEVKRRKLGIPVSIDIALERGDHLD